MIALAMPRTIGKYSLHGEIGAGGMGSVHLGWRFGSGGFRRVVAIKRLHQEYASDAAFVDGFLDEARLASRVHHQNVVAPLDVLSEDGEVFLVFEHVLGVSLATLARGRCVAPPLAAAVLVDVLAGLHAAHEATGDFGLPLDLVHRDVSPQNVLVGADGAARLLDFGIAKANGRARATADGVLKGKLGYMAPEQFSGHADRRSDVYAAGIVLWECLAGKTLFDDAGSIDARLRDRVQLEPLGHPLDDVLRKALAHAPDERFATARDMAIAIEQATALATKREVSDWLQEIAATELDERTRQVAELEGADLASPPLDPIASEPEEALTPRRGMFAALAVVAMLLLFGLSWRTLAGRASSSEPAAASSTIATTDPPPTTTPAAPSSATTIDPSPAAPPTPRAPTKGKSGTTKSAPCLPYTIDKEGHKHFNEACLR